jgi:hypothetical protein
MCKYVHMPSTCVVLHALGPAPTYCSVQCVHSLPRTPLLTLDLGAGIHTRPTHCALHPRSTALQCRPRALLCSTLHHPVASRSSCYIPHPPMRCPQPRRRYRAPPSPHTALSIGTQCLTPALCRLGCPLRPCTHTVPSRSALCAHCSPRPPRPLAYTPCPAILWVPAPELSHSPCCSTSDVR